MRLYELSDEEHKEIMSQDWKLPEQIQKWLDSKNLRPIGNASSYSMVYSRPGSNKILKINHSIDTAYKNFIEYIRQHPDPLFPKIYDVKRFEENDLYMYITEKLDECPNPWLVEHFEKYYGLFCFLEMKIKAGYTTSLSKLKIKDRFFIFMEKKAAREQKSFNNLMSETADSFENTKQGKMLKDIFSMGLHDLHYENVMIRPSTDELVIIDPIQDEY